VPRYAVLQDYGSGTYGPWERGTQVELDEHEAEWVNRDSQGTLARVKPGLQLELGQPVPADALEGAGEAEAEEQEPASDGSGDSVQPDAGGAMSTADVQPGLDAMTLEELREEAKRRGVASSGKKDEVLDRLRRAGA
jgi:SAP domain